MLAIPERQIIIISVRSGSVILELGFLRESTSAVSPVQATLLLKEATSAGKLESFGATGLSIGGQSINVPTTSSSQVPLIVGISVGGFVALVVIGVLVKHARIFIGKYKQNKKKAARVDEITKKQSMNEFVKILDNEIEYDSSSKPIISGNFGVVRKAIWNGIPVAVKTLKTNWSADDRQNFDREARLMHSVNHPNCVRLYGVCSTANEESLVMEWMDGGDLSQLLKQAPPLPMHRRISLFRQICAGLCFLHTQKSIVHSDIKAANILLSKDYKTAKIADFGLSKIRLQGAYATSANIAGTINYLPPERVLRKTLVSDRCADVYAMGALLWEMATCSVMWNGMSMTDISLALLNNERPSIPSWVEADVASVIEECWAPHPTARPNMLDLWRRMSVLDINNPEFNKSLDPYSQSFLPTCFTLEDCLRKALEPATYNGILLDMHLVNSKYNEPLLQTIIRQCSLTEVEAKCIIVYTMESNRVSKPQQLYKLFCQAYRQRNEEALEAFADFSYHFWNALSKLPDFALPLYRGLDKRLADINDLYYGGNVVHWHYPSSCTTDKAVASKFSNGGTLLSLINVTKAKSIQAFSLIPSEREYLIDHTSTFDVTISLSCEGAKALKQFSSDLPANVDLVVLTARAHALSHGFTPCAGVSSTASVFAPEPASAPSLTYQPYTQDPSGIGFCQLPALIPPHQMPSHFSSRLLSSPLPHLARNDVLAAAGVGVDSTHAFISVPQGTPGYRRSAGHPQQSSEPVGVRQAVVIELEGVRVGGVSTITHDASRQC
jgi:serine/threonine protein kinase